MENQQGGLQTRHTTIVVGKVAHLDPEKLKEQPGVDLYYVSGADVGEQIVMALLEDFHSIRTMVFVGGEQARREATEFQIAWIEDTPEINDALLKFWNETPPVWDCP
jgi:hypothetical protein